MATTSKFAIFVVIFSIISLNAFASRGNREFKRKGKVKVTFEVDETSGQHNAVFKVKGKLAKKLFQKLNPKGYQTNVANVDSRKDETEIKQSHFMQCKRDHKDFECTFTFLNDGQPAQLDELYLGGEGSIPLDQAPF